MYLFFECLLCIISLFCVFQDFFHSFHLSVKDLSSHAPVELPQSLQLELGLGFPQSFQAPEPELPPSWYLDVRCPVPLPLPLPFPLPLPVPFSHASLSF